MDNLRQRLLLLGSKRDGLEVQRRKIIKYLLERRVSSSSKLVDSEGFPRTDIDIEDIIDKRKQLAILSTDIGIVNAEIEDLVTCNPARDSTDNPTKDCADNPAKDCADNPTKDSRDNPTKDSGDNPARESPVREEPATCPQLVRTLRVNDKNEDAYLDELPLAVIEGVVENSPAAKAGLRDGDYIMRFSHYSSQNMPKLAVLGEFVNSQKGKPLSLLIRRNNAHYWLRITPMEFNKPGILGFTIKTLSAGRE